VGQTDILEAGKTFCTHVLWFFGSPFFATEDSLHGIADLFERPSDRIKGTAQQIEFFSI